MSEKSIQILYASGYDEFRKTIQDLTTKKDITEINIYFTGEKENGVSWCPDCNEAEPHVMRSLKEFGKENSVFLIIDVGDRTFWKDLSNPFRLDKEAQVAVIPTLLKWKTPCRLDGDYCNKPSLLEMFFTEDDD